MIEFVDGKYDKVVLVYNQFKNAATQIVMSEIFLPLKNDEKAQERPFNYIFEPVKQGIYINTYLSALYSLYEYGNHQEYIGVGAGP